MAPPSGSNFTGFMALLDDRIARVRATIDEACRKAGRDPDDVRLVAVTKGHPAALLEQALAAGLRDLAENRVQEALAKCSSIRDAIDALPATLHLIGHLQRNKAREAVAVFDWIQSVDSMRLARTLSDRAAREERRIHVLVQVNAAREEGKYGFDPDETVDRALEIAELPNLVLRGLMTMAPWTDDEAVLRRTFATARGSFEGIAGRQGVNTLSMGMSNDYVLAVEEGATMVRLGTVLFGPRN